MITLDDLLGLLAAHPDYEEAACFARDFGLVPDPNARVLRDDADVYLYEVPLTKGNLLDDVAHVAVWRRLGIVVACRHTESHPGCLVDEQRNPLRVTREALDDASCAEANQAMVLVRGGAFALLRRPPDRNLPMLFANGKWEVYDTDGEVPLNALRCLERLLWADVPPQKPPAPREEVVITKDELLAGIARRERETGRTVLTPEERARGELYSLIVERHRRIAEAVGGDPSLMPQVDKMLIDGMELAAAAVTIPVLDESAKGRTLCGVRACAHQSKHVCWLNGKPRRHVGEGACPISCEDFEVGPKAAPVPEHSPTPWNIGVGGLLENSVTTAVFDANGIAILTDNGVPPANDLAPGADALHAVKAVNRMEKLRALVALCRAREKSARQEVKRAHEDHRGEDGPGWEEGLAHGKMLAYHDVAEKLDSALGSAPKEHG